MIYFEWSFVRGIRSRCVLVGGNGVRVLVQDHLMERLFPLYCFCSFVNTSWLYLWGSISGYLTLVCNCATNTSDKVATILWLNWLNGLNNRKLFLARIPEMTIFIGWFLLWSLWRCTEGPSPVVFVWQRGSDVEWDTAKDWGGNDWETPLRLVKSVPLLPPHVEFSWTG